MLIVPALARVELVVKQEREVAKEAVIVQELRLNHGLAILKRAVIAQVK